MKTVLRLNDLIEYEVAASWWASWISIGWMQAMSARYFARKAVRKWNRYVVMLQRRERLQTQQALQQKEQNDG